MWKKLLAWIRGLLAWIRGLPKAIGKWKASQGPEADALHSLISYGVLLTTNRFHGNVWIAAAIMFAFAVVIEVYDHYDEPPHPIKQDIIDVLFYTIGIVGGLVIVLV